jgi:hypothetical protein
VEFDRTKNTETKPKTYGARQDDGDAGDVSSDDNTDILSSL